VVHTMESLVASKGGERLALGMQLGKGCLMGMGLLLVGVQEVYQGREF
jgi:hypothetical protein